VGEFPASIVIGRRRRQHFDQHAWVQQRVDFGVLEFRLAAHHRHVRIRVQSRGTDLDPHVGLVDLALAFSQLLAQLAVDIARDQVVFPAGAGHGENLAAEVFTFRLGLSLAGQILLRRQKRLRYSGHDKRLPWGADRLLGFYGAPSLRVYAPHGNGATP